MPIADDKLLFYEIFHGILEIKTRSTVVYVDALLTIVRQLIFTQLKIALEMEI